MQARAVSEHRRWLWFGLQRTLTQDLIRDCTPMINRACAGLVSGRATPFTDNHRRDGR